MSDRLRRLIRGVRPDGEVAERRVARDDEVEAAVTGPPEAAARRGPRPRAEGRTTRKRG